MRLRSPVDHRRVRSLITRAPGRMTRSRPPSTGSGGGGAACRHRRRRSSGPGGWAVTCIATRLLQSDISCARGSRSTALLATTDGQVLTSLPGVAMIRAAAFAAHSLPITRFPDAEHLYSATGLAPALYESATLHRRGRISRQGLAEHRDALMGIAWGLSINSPSFAQRDAELRGPWHDPDPGPGRARPQRLPPGIPTPTNPTTLR